MSSHNSESLEELRYPIGKFQLPDKITNDHIEKWLLILSEFPAELGSLVKGLSEEQLDTAYRPDGWTIRQVVHHVADSHTHSYIRFKWTLTEDKPVIKVYFEDRWAELKDSKTWAVQPSLDQLSAIHYKLVRLLCGLSENELARTFIHPEYKLELSIKQNISLYAWHCEHHYAHVLNCLKRHDWT